MMTHVDDQSVRRSLSYSTRTRTRTYNRTRARACADPPSHPVLPSEQPVHPETHARHGIPFEQQFRGDPSGMKGSAESFGHDHRMGYAGEVDAEGGEGLGRFGVDTGTSGVRVGTGMGGGVADRVQSGAELA